MGEASREPPVGPSSVSSTLLAQVKADRPEAWTRLVNLFGPVVYRWCRQTGVARDDVPDLVQDVFRAVTLNIGAFRRDRQGDSFTAWLRTITRNSVYGYYRARRGRPAAQGGTDAQERFLQVPDPAAAIEANCAQEDPGLIVPLGLDLVRAEFEDRTWQAFHRVVILRQAPARVAVDLGMSIDAVYQAKSRVLRRLRQELDGLLE